MRKSLPVISNFFVAVMSVAALFFRAGDMLSAAGIESLKYFTVLSNLLSGGVSFIYAVALLRGKNSMGIQRIKLMSTAAVAVTFFVVAAFLGPIYGHKYMYSGSNFWYHLVLPLISMLEFCFLDLSPKLRFHDTWLSGVPAFLYGLCYILNLIINGVGEWPDTNDWYGFLNWGWPVGSGIFAGIVLISLLSAWILRAVNNAH